LRGFPKTEAFIVCVFMQIIPPPEYDNLRPSEAIALQHHLRTLVKTQPLQQEIRSIGGADISFNKYSNTVYAGIVTLSYPELKPLDNITVKTIVDFPYIPGLLAFREIPALLEAWDKLDNKPDLLVLDGQGIAHTRRIGIASHFGVLTNTPSIGCAKSRLVGKFEAPDNVSLASSPMFHNDEEIGAALRTKKNCKPIFVSPGHLINTPHSLDIIKTCVGKYRVPAPTRLAHLLVNEARMQG